MSLHPLTPSPFLRFSVSPIPLLILLTTPLASASPRDYLNKPPDWFRSPDAAQIAANILSHQSPLGGWPKNTDTANTPYTGDPSKLKPIFDNSATTDELRFLARIHTATQNDTYKQAFLKGLTYILKAQYPNGGFPQSSPPGRGYPRYITFNDNSMVRLMLFLREVATQDTYAFVDPPRRKSAQSAFDRGIDCILKCQIKVNGHLTAWCAQHDEIDFSPRTARSYELPSLSGSESVAIVELLMSLNNPSPEVIQSVDSAIAWFESAKLTGIKVITVPDLNSPKGTDKRVVPDPTAPPLWARFYDIKTNRPIFCDRDGIPKPHLSDIGYERRNGYAWLGPWPTTLLTKDYPAWKSHLSQH